MVDKKKKEKVGRIKYVVVKEKRRRRKRTGKKKTAEEVKRLAEQPKYQGLSQGQVPVSSANLPPSWIRQSIAPPTTITPAQSGVFQPPGTLTDRPAQPYSFTSTLPTPAIAPPPIPRSTLPAPPPPPPAILPPPVTDVGQEAVPKRNERGVTPKVARTYASGLTIEEGVSSIKLSPKQVKKKRETEKMLKFRELAQKNIPADVRKELVGDMKQRIEILRTKMGRFRTFPDEKLETLISSLPDEDQDAELANVDQAPMPRQLTPLEQQQIQRAIQSYEPFSLFKQ